jgi:aspartate/methionine/tyrosine aminotransferase
LDVLADSGPGMLSAFMGFIEPGDEVIIFEPFFDQ